nr:hypothetical protein [Tanacetum cinerariifolium]
MLYFMRLWTFYHVFIHLGFSKKSSLGKEHVSKQGRKKAKIGSNIKEGDFNKLDDLVDEGFDYVVNERMSTDKIKVLNAEAKGVSVAGETLSTATLAISMASVQPVLLKRFENQEAKMGMRKFFKCWFHHQFTMSNRHQELTSPKANGFW